MGILVLELVFQSSQRGNEYIGNWEVEEKRSPLWSQINLQYS